MGEHGFAATAVASVKALVPSLTHRLIGRPAGPDMTPNYARLSGQYAVASALMTAGLGVEDFQPAALGDPARLELARKVGATLAKLRGKSALTLCSGAFRKTAQILMGLALRELTLNDGFFFSSKFVCY